MTQTTRHLIVGLMITALVCAARPARANDSDDATVQHVRSANAAVVALIRQAVEQSATFRGVIETINASNGIVYVEKGACSRGARACLVSVTTDGGHRFLQVHVASAKADWDVMGSIGHELRHAIEVLNNPAVTTTGDLHNFYLHGDSIGGFLTPFETRAAVEAGEAVRSEVRKYAKTHAAETR